jgi:hypothetical protein
VGDHFVSDFPVYVALISKTLREKTQKSLFVFGQSSLIQLPGIGFCCHYLTLCFLVEQNIHRNSQYYGQCDAQQYTWQPKDNHIEIFPVWWVLVSSIRRTAQASCGFINSWLALIT